MTVKSCVVLSCCIEICDLSSWLEAFLGVKHHSHGQSVPGSRGPFSKNTQDKINHILGVRQGKKDLWNPGYQDSSAVV